MLERYFIVKREKHSHSIVDRITKRSLTWLLEKNVGYFGKLLSIS